MRSAWRQILNRLSDAVPEARYEAVLALLRGTVLVAGALILLTVPHRSDLAAPIMVNLVLGAVSLAAAGGLSRLASNEALMWGRYSTALDLAAFLAYAVAFGGIAGAGSLYPVFVLLVGPLRYGARGLLVTVAPVAAIAIAWPQRALDGTVTAPQNAVALCLLFAAPVVLIRSVMMRSTARLRQAEQQFSTAFEHASIGMALLDADLRFLQANRALGVLLGQAPAVLVGRSFMDCAVAEERDAMGRSLQALTEHAPSTRCEIQLQRPDGGLRWGHVSASLLMGRGGLAPRLVVQVENVSERKRSEALLSHAAAHDALTDLPNRALLTTQLETALIGGEDVAVLFLDLDRFKVVNDGLGHAVGDELLVQLAHRLRRLIRPGDLVARQGGDEFVILCRQADEEIASEVADRVLAALKEPLTMPSGNELVIGVSIGIALAGPGDSAAEVMRDADTAMYAAKGVGGGRYRVFTPELREAVVRIHELEKDLRVAVRDDDLALVYQPVLDLTTGRVSACEALVRWEHPTRGRLLPGEFIDVAEQSELILELGDWVLRRALADAVCWPEQAGQPPVMLAVNVSLRQLLSVGFTHTVRRHLEHSGFAASRLILEVTETALATDVDTVVEVLCQLRELGLKLSIDDFGTGHASLTYLARFPVDQVKIDRSFVSGLGQEAGSAAIVGGVIAMAHTFDLRVIAEGVETEEQLAIVRSLGADAVQGFLTGRPVPIDAVDFLDRLSPPDRTSAPAPHAVVPPPRTEKSGASDGRFRLSGGQLDRAQQREDA